MKEHSTKAYKKYEADADAVYDEEYTIDLSTLRPTVAFPHLPENTKTIDEVGDIKIDLVVIGSFTNIVISPSSIHCKYTSCVPGITMTRTPGATCLPLIISAAIRISEIRPFVQEDKAHGYDNDSEDFSCTCRT